MSATFLSNVYKRSLKYFFHVFNVFNVIYFIWTFVTSIIYAASRSGSCIQEGSMARINTTPDVVYRGQIIRVQVQYLSMFIRSVKLSLCTGFCNAKGQSIIGGYRPIVQIKMEARNGTLFSWVQFQTFEKLLKRHFCLLTSAAIVIVLRIKIRNWPTGSCRYIFRLAI